MARARDAFRATWSGCHAVERKAKWVKWRVKEGGSQMMGPGGSHMASARVGCSLPGCGHVDYAPAEEVADSPLVLAYAAHGYPPSGHIRGPPPYLPRLLWWFLC